MTDYTLLRDQLLALAEDVEYEITNLSNASALLYHSLEGLNWAGFYLWRDGSLTWGRSRKTGPVPGSCRAAASAEQRQKRTRRCGGGRPPVSRTYCM